MENDLVKSEKVISKNRQASDETCRFMCKSDKKDIFVTEDDAELCTEFQ
jgi:hypothetical protein